MEKSYDPATDLTDYLVTFRATCPACGGVRKGVVTIPDVPRGVIVPAILDVWDGMMADRLTRAEARYLANIPPCGLCSPPAGDD